MKLVILSVLMAVALAASELNLEDGGKYNFNYNTEDEGSHSRTESASNGVVSGSYSYTDPNGNVRKISYTAGPDGFKPSGDISVDKKTAEEAEKLAALAPKAPEDPNAVKIMTYNGLIPGAPIHFGHHPFAYPIISHPSAYNLYHPAAYPAAYPYGYFY